MIRFRERAQFQGKHNETIKHIMTKPLIIVNVNHMALPHPNNINVQIVTITNVAVEKFNES